jgi:hypothetical protein
MKQDKKDDYSSQKKDDINKNIDTEGDKRKIKEKGNKSKNYKHNGGNKVQKTGEEKKKRDYKFEKVKEALMCMSEEMITMHKKIKAD